MAEEPRHGGICYIAQFSEPMTLISVFNSSAAPGMITPKMHEGLVTYDFELNPKPALAESWEISDDGLTYTFNLRKGVLWHDGKPFTSADVKFSLEEGWKKLHPRGKATFSKVTEVLTPDDHTVILKLSEPSPPIMAALNAYESQVIPKHIYEGTDIKTNPASNAPIGTGPFMFKEWKKGEYVKMVRNPNYWDKPKPYLDAVILRVLPDAAARAAAFEAGEVHYGGYTPIPISDAARLEALPHIGIETKGYEYTATMYIMELNNRHEALKDKRVRQALMYALDRDFIVDNIWFGYGKVATGPIASTSPYYTTEGVPMYPYDPKKAEKILDEAGWKRKANGWRFKLVGAVGPMPEMLRTAEYMKQAFKQIGIEVDLQSKDLAGFIRDVYSYNFGIGQNWLYTMADPTIGVQRLYWGKNVRKGVPFANASGYDKPRVNELFEACQTENDLAKRKAMFAEIQRIIQEDMPNLNIYEMKFITVYNTKLKNHTVGGDGPLGNLADAYFSE
jgi:peptide/nickel transport system substrate-binding protein